MDVHMKVKIQSDLLCVHMAPTPCGHIVPEHPKKTHIRFTHLFTCFGKQLKPQTNAHGGLARIYALPQRVHEIVFIQKSHSRPIRANTRKHHALCRTHNLHTK